MAFRLSILFIVIAILNVLVALAPPCAGVVGSTFYVSQPQGVLVNGRDIGPALGQHIQRDLPMAKAEAFTAVGCNSFVALLLVAGAVGLAIGHEWGRWLTVGAALLMIVALGIHDIYQLFVFRPSVMNFLDGQLPPGPARAGFKFGFGMSFFFWSWANLLIMLYLVAMVTTLVLHRFLSKPADAEPREAPRRGRRGRDDDEYED